MTSIYRFLVLIKVNLFTLLSNWLLFFISQDVRLEYTMEIFVSTDLPTKEIQSCDTDSGKILK